MITPPKPPPNVLIKQEGRPTIPAIMLAVPNKLDEWCLAVPTDDAEGTLYDVLCTRIGLVLLWHGTRTSLGCITIELLESQ